MDMLIWMLIEPVMYFFALLYEADERPVARRFTVGCATVVAIMMIVGGLIVYFARD
jgi:hypothetical protein